MPARDTAVRLRPADPAEAGSLSDLAARSKAYWGYPEDMMAAFRRKLTFSPADVAGTRTVVAELSGRMVGFATVAGDPPDGELAHLWVDPAVIRAGIGRLLWRDAVDGARRAGFAGLHIQADPYAEGFYLTMGARRVGERPSGAIPGRDLPLLWFPLRP